jgi:hypothetical protein
MDLFCKTTRSTWTKWRPRRILKFIQNSAP